MHNFISFCKKNALNSHKLLKKNMVKHFGGCCKGAGQRPFACKKILYLIGLKLKTHTRFIERKPMVKLFGEGCKGQSPFA